ncbi:MAG: hypothetical protein Q8L10_02495 [Candidatus Moranbacteria bacterium]|nr:hypothetical protein [Candidatus Moranbacteria bacterium]
MWQKIIDCRLVKKWGKVIALVFSPGFLSAVIITGVALYLSVYYKANIPFSNTMAIFGSIFGGIAGAFFKDEYDRISNKNILEKKGRSAVRNIEGIRSQIRNIEAWIIEFSKRPQKLENKRTLEEVNRHIATIDLNIVAGLADWVDIVPELKQKEELQRAQKDTIQSYIDEILKNKKTLLHASKQDGEAIKKKIEDLEKEVREIKNDSGLVLGNLSPDSYVSSASMFGQGSINNHGLNPFRIQTEDAILGSELIGGYKEKNGKK